MQPSTLSLTALQAVGAILSAIATVALAWLYLKQTGLLESQEEILERQTKLSELEHIPKVRMRSVDAYVEKGVENFELNLTNIGRGPAQDLEGKVEFLLDDDVDAEVETSWHELKYSFHTEGPISSDQSYLEGEQSEKFLLNPAGMISGEFTPKPGDGALTFDYLTDLLSRKGVEDLHLRIKIRYADIEGKEVTDEVGDIVVPIDGRTELVEAVRFGTTHEDYTGEYGFSVDRSGLKRSRESKDSDDSPEPLRFGVELGSRVLEIVVRAR